MSLFIFVWVSFMALASPTLESVKVVDVASLQECYRIRPYERISKQGDQSSKQMVTEVEIINRCSTLALSLADSQKSNLEALKKIANVVRAGHRAEAGLRVYSLLVKSDKSLSACAEPDLKNAVVSGLGHPEDYPSEDNSDVKNSFAVLDLCMKSPNFASEMKKYTKSDEVYLQRNICGYFLSKKISSDCKPPRR